MKLSLRTRLTLLWFLIVVTCVSLAVIMWGMYRQGAGSQIAGGQRAAQDACSAIQKEYRRNITEPDTSATATPDVLSVMLALTLRDAPGVEGGIWQRETGFVAYAYPTYEGTGVKRDVPEAEKPRIASLALQSIVTQTAKVELQRGMREALIVAACPLPGPGNLAAWTMKRVPAALASVYDRLALGLGLLLLFVLGSGAWVGTLIHRRARRVSSRR